MLVTKNIIDQAGSLKLTQNDKIKLIKEKCSFSDIVCSCGAHVLLRGRPDDSDDDDTPRDRATVEFERTLAVFVALDVRDRLKDQSGAESNTHLLNYVMGFSLVLASYIACQKPVAFKYRVFCIDQIRMT